MTVVPTIAAIRQRLELAREMPELIDHSNSAAVRWVPDVSTLLAEIDRLSMTGPETTTDDRLAEIELGFLGHPEDDYYFVEAKDFAWLIAEVKRLRMATPAEASVIEHLAHNL